MVVSMETTFVKLKTKGTFFLFCALCLAFCVSLLTLTGCSSKSEKHYGKGTIYLNRGKYDEAIVEFQEALKADPSFAEAHYSIGQAYTMQRKFDDALAAYKKAVETDANYLDARIALALMYLQKSEPDEAIRECQEAEKISPQAKVYVALGRIYAAIRKYNEAEGEFRKAIDADPKFMPAYLHLGNYYASRQQLDKAQEQYKAILEIDPKPACLKGTEKSCKATFPINWSFSFTTIPRTISRSFL